MTDAYVTLENQWCYVTLAAVENTLIWLCAGISMHGMATGDSAVNLANKDNCKVPFDILLACFGKRQASRVLKGTLLFLFSDLPVKTAQHFLTLINSRAKLC